MIEQRVKTFPLMQEITKVQTQYVDQVLARHIQLGYRQVVFLESRIEPTSIERPIEGVVYFKVNYTDNVQLNQRPFHDNHSVNDIHHLKGNYVYDDLIQLLKKEQFDCDQPTFFLWIGEVSYLRRGEVILVLEKIRNQVKHFRLTLDYVSSEVITRTTGCIELDEYLDEWEKVGLHWIHGFKDIQSFAKGLGLQVVETVSAVDLDTPELISNPLIFHLFQLYFFCTLARI
jgi:O-methyltransferase involved in polyketide biosynthesis